MRILFISSWYPTTTNPNFGVFVKEHASAIKLVGNEVVVLAIVIIRSNKLWSKKISDSIDNKGIRTVLIEINTCFRDYVYHALPLQFLILKKTNSKHLQKDFQPDIIHSNVIFPAGILGHWLAKSLKKPHVITEHWTRVRNFSQMPVLSRWGKKAYQNAVRILPVSKFLQNEIMQSFKITESKRFSVIGNVIDPKTFCFKEKKTNNKELKLCSIATWTFLKHPAKQPELLINAVSELQKEITQTIQLTMIGGGDKVEELKELCRTKSVNAIFTGYLDKLEIAKYLQDADFFVHPTTIETFGVVVAEALLTGTPVICSNVSALKELINETNGILCENNINDWIRGIKIAAKTTFDRKQMSSAIQQKYDLNHIGIAINSVYNELI